MDPQKIVNAADKVLKHLSNKTMVINGNDVTIIDHLVFFIRDEDSDTQNAREDYHVYLLLNEELNSSSRDSLYKFISNILLRYTTLPENRIFFLSYRKGEFHDQFFYRDKEELMTDPQYIVVPASLRRNDPKEPLQEAVDPEQVVKRLIGKEIKFDFTSNRNMADYRGRIKIDDLKHIQQKYIAHITVIKPIWKWTNTQEWRPFDGNWDDYRYIVVNVMDMIQRYYGIRVNLVHMFRQKRKQAYIYTYIPVLGTYSS